MPKETAKTVFGRIASGELPAEIVYQDDLCLAFRDKFPQAPVHVLIIPRRPLASLAETSDADAPLLGHLLRVAACVAAAEGLTRDGYRVVANCGRHGGQTVAHLHLHLLGGRQMGWPPG